ncbi:DUF1206 domain-containing protein [Streptomyces sp. NPDC006326]|uniref:DUF1206 domain-containing protein n=1 Tax=Streptomyces sp. NPDC006326 TaxID=3156752 RepID=UPI0033B10BB6
MRSEAAHEARRAASSGGKGREVTARSGLAARGVLYVLVGLLAVRVAFGGGGEEADRRGALQKLAEQPLGEVLIWAVGIGLVGMMLWRLSEAVFGEAGADTAPAAEAGAHEAASGRSARRGGSFGTGSVWKRIAAAARAVFYAVAAFSVLSFAAGSGGGRSSDEQSRDVTAKTLGLPAGQWLVGAAGLAIGIAGVVIAVQAARLSFRKELAMGGASARLRKAVDFLGVSGGLARGAVFAAAGAFIVYAAVQFDPGQAKGIDDTLRAFAGTPAGPWLLVVVAVGLVLFGVFCWALARWRKV